MVGPGGGAVCCGAGGTTVSVGGEGAGSMISMGSSATGTGSVGSASSSGRAGTAAAGMRGCGVRGWEVLPTRKALKGTLGPTSGTSGSGRMGRAGVRARRSLRSAAKSGRGDRDAGCWLCSGTSSSDSRSPGYGTPLYRWGQGCSSHSSKSSSPSSSVVTLQSLRCLVSKMWGRCLH